MLEWSLSILTAARFLCADRRSSSSSSGSNSDRREREKRSTTIIASSHSIALSLLLSSLTLVFFLLLWLMIIELHPLFIIVLCDWFITVFSFFFLINIHRNGLWKIIVKIAIILCNEIVIWFVNCSPIIKIGHWRSIVIDDHYLGEREREMIINPKEMDKIDFHGELSAIITIYCKWSLGNFLYFGKKNPQVH